MGARRMAIELAGEDVGSRVVVRPGRAWPIGVCVQLVVAGLVTMIFRV